MMSMRLGAVIVLLTVNMPGAVFGNDSTAALGAGGLVLTENSDIRMASEDLFISRKIIRIGYSFVNESGSPITTRVAFPLPEINFGDLEESDVVWPTEDPNNFVGFKLTVDGKAVTPDLEQKAVYGGKDVTAVLRRLGVPFLHDSYKLGEALKALPKAARKELEERGLASISESHAVAAWTLKSTFHWEQTFPADRPVTVTHEYRPVVGASFTNPEMFLRDPEAFRRDYRDYCVDEATNAGIGRRLRAEQARHGDTALLMLHYLEYVLVTGRNWKGPIGNFRLTLDKGHTDNLVSLCMDGVRKTGPTTFSVERKDFVPEKNLKVLFIEPTEN